MADPILVVGGGLAGLAAAAAAARAGREVVLAERAHAPGGRAATHDEKGFLFNFGPHAFYNAGAGMRVVRELGIEPAGGIPGVSGSFALKDGCLHTLPGGFLSLVTTSLF